MQKLYKKIIVYQIFNKFLVFIPKNYKTIKKFRKVP